MCVATGGWRDSALLKLGAVGISIGNIPLASSDDAHERESIMLLAHERARAHKKCEAFEVVMYVGDHIWDFVNSEKLGYRFVGIGRGDQNNYCQVFRRNVIGRRRSSRVEIYRIRTQYWL